LKFDVNLLKYRVAAGARQCHLVERSGWFLGCQDLPRGILPGTIRQVKGFFDFKQEGFHQTANHYQGRART
jgi:hypothetical protein